MGEDKKALTLCLALLEQVDPERHGAVLQDVGERRRQLKVRHHGDPHLRQVQVLRRSNA